MEFINNTNLSKSVFFDLIKNINSRIEKDYDITITYIDNINNIGNDGIYIIRNTSINKEKITYFDKFFTFNIEKYNYEIFYSKNNIPLIYRYNNAYIFSYDIFRNLDFIIFNNLSFIKDEYFNFAFSEHLIMEFLNSIIKICENENIKIKQTLSKKAKYFATFDIDRVQYFSFFKTIFYFFAKKFSNNKKYYLYFELKKKYKKDIWNNIDRILKILKNKNIKALFFIMVINRDKFGKRYSITTAKKIIKQIKKDQYVGLHLSYESGENIKRIKKEIKKFNTINKCKFVRYHYLYELQKKHYEELKKNNIVMDSSTGFRNKCGFKKGFSKEYIIPGYSIIEIPVICMDSAYNIQKLQNKQYSLEKIMQEIINTNGIFTFIFHQSALNKETFGYEYILNDFFEIIKEYKLNSINIEELLNL